MDVAKGGFYMWANTGSNEGWVHSSNVRDITTGEEEGNFSAKYYCACTGDCTMNKRSTESMGEVSTLERHTTLFTGNN